MPITFSNTTSHSCPPISIHAPFSPADLRQPCVIASFKPFLSPGLPCPTMTVSQRTIFGQCEPFHSVRDTSSPETISIIEDPRDDSDLGAHLLDPISLGIIALLGVTGFLALRRVKTHGIGVKLLGSRIVAGLLPSSFKDDLRKIFSEKGLESADQVILLDALEEKSKPLARTVLQKCENSPYSLQEQPLKESFMHLLALGWSRSNGAMTPLESVVSEACLLQERLGDGAAYREAGALAQTVRAYLLRLQSLLKDGGVACGDLDHALALSAAFSEDQVRALHEEIPKHVQPKDLNALRQELKTLEKERPELESVDLLQAYRDRKTTEYRELEEKTERFTREAMCLFGAEIEEDGLRRMMERDGFKDRCLATLVENPGLAIGGVPASFAWLTANRSLYDEKSCFGAAKKLFRHYLMSGDMTAAKEIYFSLKLHVNQDVIDGLPLAFCTDPDAVDFALHVESMRLAKVAPGKYGRKDDFMIAMQKVPAELLKTWLWCWEHYADHAAKSNDAETALILLEIYGKLSMPGKEKPPAMVAVLWKTLSLEEAVERILALQSFATYPNMILHSAYAYYQQTSAPKRHYIDSVAFAKLILAANNQLVKNGTEMYGAKEPLFQFVLGQKLKVEDLKTLQQKFLLPWFMGLGWDGKKTYAHYYYEDSKRPSYDPLYGFMQEVFGKALAQDMMPVAQTAQRIWHELILPHEGGKSVWVMNQALSSATDHAWFERVAFFALYAIKDHWDSLTTETKIGFQQKAEDVFGASDRAKAIELIEKIRTFRPDAWKKTFRVWLTPVSSTGLVIKKD